MSEDTAPGGTDAYPDDLSDLPGDFGKNTTTSGHGDADDLADTAGNKGPEPNCGPYPRYPAKYVEDSKYGSTQPATVVGGLYAAEHGKARGKFPAGKGGYDAVAALGAIQASTAKARGLIDHIPSEAEQVRWYREHCDATWELPNEASVTPAGLKAAIKGLDATRKIALTTIDALAADGAPWAVRVAARTAADNLDAGVKAKPYSYTLTELYNDYDAAVADLVGLPPMTTETRLASLRLLREWAATENQRAQDGARKREAARKTPRRPLAEVIRHVADMVNDEPTGTVVDGLIYEQMVIHWVGDGGTYKTFTVLGLACSVAAGRDFTHRLKVPQRRPVLYLCAERRHYGLGADVAAWCQRNGLDIGGLELLGWDDVVQLGDDVWMAELIEFVVARSIKLIVFDTQRKATRGMEENSATDMSVALANAQKLAMEANAAVIVIHHTTRGQDHARGSSVGRDDTDATVLQKATGPNEAEFIIDKHKSEATGTRFPIKVEAVTGTVPPTEARAGYGFTTMVAAARDPLSMDETAEQMLAALNYDDKILVAVVNDHDGDDALTPAEVERRAKSRGCGLKKDATAKHLHQLASYGLITETVNPVSKRKTYSPKASATALKDSNDAIEADVVNLASRRSVRRPKPAAIPPGAE